MRHHRFGPGALVAAAFIGPGTVTTATLAGTGYGYALLWTVLFSIVGTYVLQEMSIRLALVGDMDLGQAIAQKSDGIRKKLAIVLIVSAIFIGNAAYEAGNITGALLGFEHWIDSGSEKILVILGIGLMAGLLLFFGNYRQVQSSLVFLVSTMGLVFILTAILVGPDLGSILRGLFIPRVPENAWLVCTGLVGTTIVPYNLFLHASAVRKQWRSEDLSIARKDAFISILLGGVITMCIIICAAAVSQSQQVKIEGLSDLSRQLSPVLGDWSSVFLSIGFLAAGLSSAITAPLAAAYAISGLLSWEDDDKSHRFRMIWCIVLLVGITFACMGWKPISVIFFAQIANGMLLPVVAIFLLLVVNDRSTITNFRNNLWQNVLGGVVVALTLLLAAKSFYTVFMS